MHDSRAVLFSALTIVTFAVPVGASAGMGSDPISSTTALEFHPQLPKIPNHRFQVKTFGAVGDGVADDTRPIQSAIDAARSAGGGIVEIPAGVFLSGPLHFAQHLTLNLNTGAVLKMLSREKYPGGTEHPEDFISGSNLQDVAVTGQGTIDGQGEPWWPFARVKGAKRPRMIALSACDRVLIENVTLMNAPMFHIAIGGKSTEVTVRGVTIRAPASDDPDHPSHNTDACDVSGKNILIKDCDVSVGDDNFTCGGGTSNVLIVHCKYGRGHGVSIGSHTAGGVTNITVRDCTFDHTECGIRIKSNRDRGGVVQHMRYENLHMTDVGCPILIYGAYMATDRTYRDLDKLSPEVVSTYPSAPMGERTPVFHDIIFRNITATTVPGRRAGLIWGLPEAPASDIRLENVSIKADRPFGIYFADNVDLDRCAITTPAGINQLSIHKANVEITP